MTRHRLSTPRLARAAAAAALLALTSCGAVSRDAARVGDASLAASEFEALLAGMVEVSPHLREPSGAFNGFSARGLLTEWITTEILRGDLARRGIQVTDADRAATAEQLASDPTWDGTPQVVRDFLIEVNTVQAVFERGFEASDAELRARYANGPAAVGVACVRALLVSTEEEASDALERVDAGEDFADVAADVSLDASAADGGALIDPGTGLPCLDWSTLEGAGEPALVEALAGAAPGETVGPVSITGGVVVMQVRPYDEVADAVRTLVTEAAALQARAELVRSAEPWVSPRFGRWNPASGAVVGLR